MRCAVCMYGKMKRYLVFCIHPARAKDKFIGNISIVKHEGPRPASCPIIHQDRKDKRSRSEDPNRNE